MLVSFICSASEGLRPLNGLCFVILTPVAALNSGPALLCPPDQERLGLVLDEATGSAGEAELAEKALARGSGRLQDACGQVGSRQFSDVTGCVLPRLVTAERVVDRVAAGWPG